MAFLQVKEASVAKEAGSSYIQTSGIYDLNLKHCQVVNTTNGAVQVNYFFDKIMSYGNGIIKIDGQPSFGYKILEALTATLGEEILSDPEPTTVTFKKGAKELPCIPELNDVNVKAWIQFKYRMYKGEISEDVVVKRFYRASDGASGSESLTQEDIGERIGKDAEFAKAVIYEDGVTEDSVAAWKAAKSGKDVGGAKAPSAAAKSGFPGSSSSAKKGFPGA